MKTNLWLAVVSAITLISGCGGDGSSAGGSGGGGSSSDTTATAVAANAPLSVQPTTVLLLHFENNLADASGRHSVSADTGTQADLINPAIGLSSRKFVAASKTYFTYLNSGDWNLGSNDFDIQFSMRTTSSAPMYLFGQYPASCNGGNTFAMDVSGAVVGMIRFQLSANGNNYAIPGNKSVIDGAWHIIHATRVAGTVNLYIDGVLQSTHIGLYGTVSSLNNLTIGRPGDCDAQYFDGNIDEFRLNN